MGQLTLQFSPKVKERTITVKLDREWFEKLASLFGFFNPEFLKSLERSESDYRSGRYRKIRSLKDLD